MFGSSGFIAIATASVLLTGVVAGSAIPSSRQARLKPAMVRPFPSSRKWETSKVSKCLTSADWTINWLGNPILLGDADPAKEFRDLIGSSQCGAVTCHKGTSASFTHKVAGPEELVDTSYRIEMSEAWFNNQVMKDVMTEVVAQGMRPRASGRRSTGSTRSTSTF